MSKVMAAMDRDQARNWMWSEACEMLMRAERLHRELFRPAGSAAQLPAWEPPVDMLETERAVLVFVALPGVKAEQVHVVIDGVDLVVVGVRSLPPELQTAIIHRLELPQGRFERRIRLPAGRYRDIGRAAADGYLVITLEKAETLRG